MAATPTRTAVARTLAERIADRVAAFDPASIAPDVAHKAKLCLLDYLSCALEAHGLPWCRDALAVVPASAAASTAAVVGTALRAHAHDAAFANAVLGHALVRDDMHLGSVSHLGVVVLPAVLALAERRPVDGRALLAAIVCGYEAGGKIGRAILDVDVAKVFRPTGIAGPIGAAAAGAKLLGLDAAATASALALAANTVAGYNEWAATGGSEMFFQVGFAARNAVTAVDLAAAGARASASALDGPAGLLAAFRKPLEPHVPPPFGDGAEILAVFFKPVPACNFAQSPAQAAQAIARDARPDVREIERVVARVTRAAAAYPGCDAPGPFLHVLEAKMSIQYNVAVGLAEGAFDEASYRPREQPEIARLASAVRLEVDPDLTAAYPARQGAEILVAMRDGTAHRRRVDDVVPAGEDDVRRRFVSSAERRLGPERARRLLDAVLGVDAAGDVAPLLALVGSAGRSA